MNPEWLKLMLDIIFHDQPGTHDEMKPLDEGYKAIIADLRGRMGLMARRLLALDVDLDEFNVVAADLPQRTDEVIGQSIHQLDDSTYHLERYFDIDTMSDVEVAYDLIGKVVENLTALLPNKEGG